MKTRICLVGNESENGIKHKTAKTIMFWPGPHIDRIQTELKESNPIVLVAWYYADKIYFLGRGQTHLTSCCTLRREWSDDINRAKILHGDGAEKTLKHWARCDENKFIVTLSIKE